MTDGKRLKSTDPPVETQWGQCWDVVHDGEKWVALWKTDGRPNRKTRAKIMAEVLRKKDGRNRKTARKIPG